MSLDLGAIKARCKRASQPKTYCGDCGQRIATQEDLDATKEGEGAELCWGDFGDCGVVFGIYANWRAGYSADVPALVAEVERLRVKLEEAHLLRIEAQNPGIDMDEVRRHCCE